MKFIKFILLGVVFGITLTKAEITSWFRIYEMFKFQSFHMFGVIGSAVILGILYIQVIKRFKLKDNKGETIVLQDKAKYYKSALLGGIIFGFGWAMTGACPGPLFILVGNGVSVILLSISAAILGTFVYGKLKNKLPH